MTGPQRASSGALRAGILIVATMTTGLTAGVFTIWSNTVMPGLSTVDDRTFVTAARALDASITNPLFLGVELMGAVLFISLAVVLHLRAGLRPVLVWVSVALACYLVTLVVTFTVHEPLNLTIRTVGELDGNADFSAARASFDEARWTMWNTVRAVAATVAFGCLTMALAIRRRLA